MPDPEPIYCWQVLDPRDGRWGTISVYLAAEKASDYTGDGEGFNLVLQTREAQIALGDYKGFAELHKQFGSPVRLVRYTPDPEPVEEL